MAQTFKTSIVVDGNVNASGFYGDGSNLTGITPTGALLLTGGDMTGSLTITAGGIPLTLTSSQNTGLVVDGGTNSGVIADFKFGTRKAYISTSGNIYASGLFDIDDTNYYVNPAGFSNVSGLNVASSEVAIALTGTQSRISFKDQDNVWTGYVGFSGNVGSLDFPGRNVRITAGYNGTIELNTGASGYNSGRIHVPYGYLSVDNAGVYATAFYDSNDSGYYVDPASTSNLNALNVGGQAVITAGNIGSQSVNYATSAGNANTLDGIDSSAFVQKYNVYSGGNHNMDVWNNVHAAYSDNSNTSSWIVVQTSVPQDSYSMGGFELVFEEDYEAASEGGTLKIYGYWNPETNGGFIGFKYTTDNPLLNPNIYVARNTTSGNTAFLIQGGNTSYAQIIARNLWLGYSASGATTTWGDGWSISEQADQSGFTNIDQLINASRSYFQPASTAITTSNIGSQSVNYANSAGAVYGNQGNSFGLNDTKLYLRTNGDNNHYLWNAADDWEELNAYEGTGLRITSVQGGTGILYVYGSSNGGYTYSPYSFRAPVFYDSNNTGYYLDPHATSNLNTVQANTIRNDGSVSSDDGFGIYWTDTADTGYAIYREPGGWSHPYPDLRIAFHTGIKLGANAGYNGIRFYTDYDMATQVMSVNNASDGYGAGHVHVNNIMHAGGSHRAPIFYDSNDTGYYLDPASNSRINTIYFDTLRNPSGNWILGQDSSTTFSIGSSAVSDTMLISATYITQTSRVTLTDDSYYRGSPTYGFRFNNNADTINALIVNNSGDSIAYSSHRAPIFYDSNDTGYYVNPNGMSSMYGVAIRGDNSSTDTSNQIFFWSNGNSTTSAIGFKSNGGYFPNPTGAGDGYNTYLTMDTDGRGWVFRRGVGGSDFGAAYTSGWILNNGVWQANSSMRAPIFYDSNNTGYYVDPSSQSNVDDFRAAAYRGNANVGGTGTATWHPDGIYVGSTQWLYGTQYRNGATTSGQGWLYIDTNFGQSIVGTYASTRYQGVWAMGDSYKLPADGTSTGSLYGLAWSHPNAGGVAGNLNTHGLLVMENGTFLAAVSGSIRSRDDMRAPIFYDSNDTNFYLNPNGTSELSTISNGTKARWGRSIYNTNRQAYESGQGYWTGTNGWGTTEGTWDTAWKGGFSGWDIWGGSSAHPQGSQYIHAQGIVSGQHYTTADGAIAYGWMMVGAHNATDNRYWLRGKWDASVSGWVEMYTTGNMDAPNKSGTSYYQTNTWMQFNGFYGLYWPAQYGAHFLPNNGSSYTQFRLDGSKNGYGGIYDAHSAVNGMMYDGSGNGGVYRESTGRWYFYHHLGNNCTGINTSTTSSAYGLYVDKGIYSTGDITAYSDVRKKTNIATIDSALDKVTRLRGVYYDRIDDLERGRQIGVIAQEVNEVLPEAVTYAEDIDEYGVKYGNIVGVLIEAIKEQQKQIEELKAIVDGLTK